MPWWDKQEKWDKLGREESLSDHWNNWMGYGGTLTYYSTFRAGDDKSSAESLERESLERKNLLYNLIKRLAVKANLIINDEEIDRRLYLKLLHDGSPYSERVSNPRSDHIPINPDPYMDAKENERGFVLDAMSGQVMTEVMARATICKSEWQKAYGAGIANASQFGLTIDEGKLAFDLFTIVEAAVARDRLVKEWPGFVPFLQRHAELVGPKDELQAWIDTLPKDKKFLNAAIHAIGFNLTSLDGETATLPPSYGAGVEEASEILTASTKTKRFSAVVNAILAMKKHGFVLEDEKEGEPQGDGKQPGNGGEEGEPPPDGEKEKEKEKPKPPGGVRVCNVDESKTTETITEVKLGNMDEGDFGKSEFEKMKIPDIETTVDYGKSVAVLRAKKAGK
jgi:hypothetical protein